jgi:carboxylesterase
MKDYSFHMPGTSGKGVLLIHGLTGSPPEMRFVAKRLNRVGFACSSPVLAGHCRDMDALHASTYEDWIASVHEAIDKFAPEVDELYAAGICVGGQLALLAAHQRPGKIKKVAIYSPMIRYDGWNTPIWWKNLQWMIPFAAHMPILRDLTFPESHPFGLKSDRLRKAVAQNSGDGIEGTLPEFSLKGLYQNFRLNKALKKALPDMTVPTLLIHAREDDVSSPRNSIRLKAMHGGECHIEWLDDSYHMIHVDQERQKVADLTAAFFGVPQEA